METIPDDDDVEAQSQAAGGYHFLPPSPLALPYSAISQLRYRRILPAKAEVMTESFQIVRSVRLRGCSQALLLGAVI